MTCIEDLRAAAQRRVPRMFYDYVASGSWTETTLRANESYFNDIQFRQRILVDIEKRSLAWVPSATLPCLAPSSCPSSLVSDMELETRVDVKQQPDGGAKRGNASRALPLRLWRHDVAKWRSPRSKGS